MAYYLGELVYHFFGNGKEPTAGGVVGVILLLIYALSKLTGSLYMSASIVAIIVWLSIMIYVVEFLFRKKEIEQSENYK